LSGTNRRRISVTATAAALIHAGIELAVGTCVAYIAAFVCTAGVAAAAAALLTRVFSTALVSTADGIDAGCKSMAMPPVGQQLLVVVDEDARLRKWR